MDLASIQGQGYADKKHSDKLRFKYLGAFGFYFSDASVCWILTKQIENPMEYLCKSISKDDLRALTAIREMSEINEFVILAINLKKMLIRLEDMNRALVKNRLSKSKQKNGKRKRS